MRSASVSIATLLCLAGLLVVAAGQDPDFGVEWRTGKADVAVVLSGDVDYLRVRGAAGLYRQGRVSWLLVTGNGIGGDNAPDLARVAVAEGVPADRIAQERTSRSTRENMTEASRILRLRGWRRAAVVTSASHMRRAIDAARRSAPDIEWLVAPVPDAGPNNRVVRNRIEERLKWLWYALRGWV